VHGMRVEPQSRAQLRYAEVWDSAALDKSTVSAGRVLVLARMTSRARPLVTACRSDRGDRFLFGRFPSHRPLARSSTGISSRRRASTAKPRRLSEVRGRLGSLVYLSHVDLWRGDRRFSTWSGLVSRRSATKSRQFSGPARRHSEPSKRPSPAIGAERIAD
jgi:hypothetical protein